MTSKRILRLSLLLTPIPIFAAWAIIATSSIPLSLAVAGYSSAEIVPKQRLRVFDYVPVDSLRASAIVFSDSKAVGWIYSPLVGFPRFVRFADKSSFDGGFPSFVADTLPSILQTVGVLWVVADALYLSAKGVSVWLRKRA